MERNLANVIFSNLYDLLNIYLASTDNLPPEEEEAVVIINMEPATSKPVPPPESSLKAASQLKIAKEPPVPPPSVSVTVAPPSKGDRSNKSSYRRDSSDSER